MKIKIKTVSHLIAVMVLFVDLVSTFAVLYLCYISILRSFTGSLPYLTTLIGALQAATCVVLASYFNKSKAENTRNGINYDAIVKEGKDETV